MPALELARENIALNNLDQGNISFLKEDVTEFMKGALLRNELWDVVVLDPPKLAPRKKVAHQKATVQLKMLLSTDFFSGFFLLL